MRPFRARGVEYVIRDKGNCEHYVWGDHCRGWRLVDEDNLSVIEEEMPPHTAETMHLHKSAQQLFYIKSGVAQFEADGDEYRIGPNQGFHIKPGILHRIRNDSEENLEFIVISQPSTRGDRFETR